MSDRNLPTIQINGVNAYPYFSLDDETLREHGLSLVNLGDAVSPPDLGRSMSTRSILSSADSNAIREQDAAENAQAPGGCFRSIGKGLCAEVFNFAGTGRAIKKLHRKHPREDLWMDLIMHRGTYEAITMAKYACSDLALQVPQVHAYYSTRSSWWTGHGPSFPTYSREPNDVLVTERILPMTAKVRNALIDAYCPSTRVVDAKCSEENKDCLVRVYLGRRIKTDLKHREWTGLRNFEADLSVLVPLLGDEVNQHAYSMGVALAYMHFSAKHDARDVEFVLGTAPAKPEVTWNDMKEMERYTPLDSVLDFKRRIVQLWLLDFNQCREIGMDLDGMHRAVGAYFDNDPYYPRAVPPDHEDYGIWGIFRLAYQEAADELGYSELAKYFCGKVHGECMRRTMTTPKSPPRTGLFMHLKRGGRKGKLSKPRAGRELSEPEEVLESWDGAGIRQDGGNDPAIQQANN